MAPRNEFRTGSILIELDTVVGYTDTFIVDRDSGHKQRGLVVFLRNETSMLLSNPQDVQAFIRAIRIFLDGDILPRPYSQN